LDVVVLKEAPSKPVHRKFSNKKEGHAELLAFCADYAPLTSCHFCMESTGNYGFGIATALSARGCLVSVENPRFIKHFAIGRRIQNKTDKTDAKAIAQYCRETSPRPWVLRDPDLRELEELLKRLADVEKLRVMEANRLEGESLDGSAKASVQRILKFLQAESETLIQELESCLARQPKIQEMVRVLVKEPGAGELTALRVLSHLGWSHETFDSAQQCAAAAGYNPVRRESGKMVGRTRISKQGDAAFRGQMHMVAVVAIQFNPKVKVFYEKRLAAGMSKLAAVTACARKLLMILYGILKAHASGKTPEYSKAKLRYRDLRGRQRLFSKKRAVRA
jgi:transposase